MRSRASFLKRHSTYSTVLIGTVYAISITTNNTASSSLKRNRLWHPNKPFSRSWYVMVQPRSWEAVKQSIQSIRQAHRWTGRKECWQPVQAPAHVWLFSIGVSSPLDTLTSSPCLLASFSLSSFPVALLLISDTCSSAHWQCFYLEMCPGKCILQTLFRTM